MRPARCRGRDHDRRRPGLRRAIAIAMPVPIIAAISSTIAVALAELAFPLRRRRDRFGSFVGESVAVVSSLPSCIFSAAPAATTAGASGAPNPLSLERLSDERSSRCISGRGADSIGPADRIIQRPRIAHFRRAFIERSDFRLRRRCFVLARRATAGRAATTRPAASSPPTVGSLILRS